MSISSKYIPLSQGDTDKDEDSTTSSNQGTESKKAIRIATTILCFNITLAILSVFWGHQLSLIVQNLIKEEDIYALPRPDPFFGLVKQPTSL
jgi:hypothetical protein